MKHSPIDLPLGDADPVTPPVADERAAEGELPEQADLLNLLADPALSPVKPASIEPGVVPPATANATRLARAGQYISQNTLFDIAQLRGKHLERGHSPESDQSHGTHFFINGSRHYVTRALQAKSAKRRRDHLVAAAAMIVALIDKEELAQKLNERPKERPEERDADAES